WSAYLLNAKLYNKYTDIFAYMQGLFVLNTFVFNNLTQFEETLRTPLVSILGNTEIFSSYFDELSKSEILEMNDSISRAGQRLKRSIEKFLKYADLTIQKINGVDRDEEFSLFDTCQHNCEYAITNCYDCLKRIDDISIEIENALLKIPQNDFEVILIELISNACKFSKKGTPIVVKGEIVDKEYIVTVNDKGRGIDKRDIQRIDSFIQFDRNYYQQDGNGIGLALVKLICEKFDVRFSIESVVDEFTTVKLKFKI
ncbi:MAG: sensor histidine kinase, partial [Melioribacteraceae bacterium]|nr:sensor histidine kinase [Melioribacteraceae bacterium]